MRLMTEPLPGEIALAERRIRPHVLETPLIPSLALGEAVGADVSLKCENQQLTGSFKLRGATNRLLTLPADELSRGVVAASSGNHGIAVAQAGSSLGIPVTVYVPEAASSAKIAAMRRRGAEVRLFGTDGLDTELEARRVAGSSYRTYISPYNDLAVVAGQGTVAVELRRQAPEMDTVIVSVGGGGLIAGIAACLKASAPAVRVIGAVPEQSPVMARSVQAGHVVVVPTYPTLSDGTAGGIETDSVTFPLCRDLVDEWIELPESEIAGAMRHCIVEEHLLVEGSAGVAVAATWRLGAALRGRRVVVVLCGANVSAETLNSVL